MGPVTYDTREIASYEQFSFWNDLVCNVFTQMDCLKKNKAGGAFTGQLTAWDLSQLQIAIVDCEKCHVHHSKWHVSKTSEDVFLMHVQLSGSSLNSQNGYQEVLMPGDFALCSSASPYTLTFEDRIKMMVVRIPRTILQKYIADPDQIIGIKIDRSHGLNKVLVDYMKNIWRQNQSIDQPAHQLAVSNIVLNLLAASYEQVTPAAIDNQCSAVREGHMQRIKMMIDRRLSDPGLSPGSIAADSNVSTRYLRMLFSEKEITCGRYIMQRRLEEVAKRLRDQSSRHISISEMAYRWGFASPSHFSKNFKQNFGLTPKAYRAKFLESMDISSGIQ